MNIENSIVLITGASDEIGFDLVAEFLRRRVSKIYVAARKFENLAKVVEIAPDRLIPLELDVTDEEQIKSAAKFCGDIKILVNNAGISLDEGLISAPDTESLIRELDVNCLGILRMSRAFAPILASTGGGAIVNMLSILARAHLPFSGSYSVSKAAALSVTHGIRAELAKQKTLVVAVMPGTVNSLLAINWPDPKVAPSAIAKETLEALIQEQEDVYPGDLAKQLSSQLLADPKAVEKYMAGFLPGQNMA